MVTARELVNGITKETIDTGFRYYFPIAFVETNTTDTTITVRLTIAPFTNDTNIFANITNQLEAANIEGYADALATL